MNEMVLALWLMFGLVIIEKIVLWKVALAYFKLEKQEIGGKDE